MCTVLDAALLQSSQPLVQSWMLGFSFRKKAPDEGPKAEEFGSSPLRRSVLGGSFSKSAVNLLSTASDSFRGRQRPNRSSSSALSRSKSSSRAAIKAAFDVFDTDRSGSLSAAELKQVLTRPGGGSPLSLDEVQAIIEEFDTDGDGELQFEEFAVFWAPAVQKAPSVLSVAAASPDEKARKVRLDPKPPAVKPRAAAAQQQLQKASKPSNPSAPPPDDPLKKLRSKAALLDDAEAATAEAAALDLQASSATTMTFDRRLGAALINKNMADTSRSKLNELVRAFDKNGDGEVQLMEFRQAVRGTLKLKADNKEIDDFFAGYDTDGGGTLDAAELKALLKSLREEATAAQLEQQRCLERARVLRARDVKLRAAAEGMTEVDRFYERLEQIQRAQPVDIRLATVLMRRQVKSVDAIARWPDCGRDALVGREAWSQGVNAYLKGPEAPRPNEVRMSPMPPNSSAVNPIPNPLSPNPLPRPDSQCATQCDEFFDQSVAAEGQNGKLQLKLVLRKALLEALRANEEIEQMTKQSSKLYKAAAGEQKKLEQV